MELLRPRLHLPLVLVTMLLAVGVSGPAAAAAATPGPTVAIGAVDCAAGGVNATISGVEQPLPVTLQRDGTTVRTLTVQPSTVPTELVVPLGGATSAQVTIRYGGAYVSESVRGSCGATSAAAGAAAAAAARPAAGDAPFAVAGPAAVTRAESAEVRAAAAQRAAAAPAAEPAASPAPLATESGRGAWLVAALVALLAAAVAGTMLVRNRRRIDDAARTPVAERQPAA